MEKSLSSIKDRVNRRQAEFFHHRDTEITERTFFTKNREMPILCRSRPSANSVYSCASRIGFFLFRHLPKKVAISPLRVLCVSVVKYYIFLKILAGLPATMVFGGTLRLTRLPAPTMAFSPMVMLPRMVEPEPMEAPFLTTVGSTLQSVSVLAFRRDSSPGDICR